MHCDAIIYNRGGGSDLVMYRGEPMSAIMAHARNHVDGGSAIRVEIRNVEGKLIAHYPRVLRRA